MDDIERKKIYELLHISTVLETVDSEANITESFALGMITEKPTRDFLDNILSKNHAIIREKISNLQRDRLYLQKKIKVFNDSIKSIFQHTGGSPFETLTQTQTHTSTSTFQRKKLYRPETVRTNLSTLINHVITSEKELIDVMMYSLINQQWEEINTIKGWVYKEEQIARFDKLAPIRPIGSRSILDKRPSFKTTHSFKTNLPEISTRPPSRNLSTISSVTSIKRTNSTKLPVIIPKSVHFSGGSPFYSPMLNTLKSNCESFNIFFIGNYNKLKQYVNKTNTAIKEQYQKEKEAYGKLSLFGKLTFVETAFFRLLKFSVERILGFKEGRIDQVNEGFIGKIMYFYSLFSSFTGIVLPPLLTVLGLTAIEAAIKTAMIVAGCKTLGIILAINVSIMILYYIKKAIDKRASKATRAIRMSTPVDILGQPKVSGLMRLIKPNMTEAEYANMKLQIKNFIFGVPDEEPELSKELEEHYDKFPNVAVPEEEDREIMESLISTTYTMTNNTDDTIGEASDAIISKGSFVFDKDTISDTDKEVIKMPKNVKAFKKLTCTLILNLDVAENDTANLINKINKIVSILTDMEKSKKGGGKILNKLMTYKLNDLKMYYKSKTGIVLDGGYKKKDIVEKIIEITKSN